MKVLVLVYPGMTLQDTIGPIQAWSLMPDYEVQFVWKTPGEVLTDSGLPVIATHDFSTAWSDPDVLMVGGGARPTIELLGDQQLSQFLASRGEKAKWVCSVCTGSLLLGSAGLLKGYRAACHWSARDQLRQFGAEPSEERVCIDRNRLSGGGVTSGIDFGIAVAGKWAGDDMGRAIELVLEYAPQPPYGTGRPELADDKTRETVSKMLAEAM